MKPVIVKWHDIVSWTGWNEELIENEEDEPALYFTTGFVLNHTDTKLTITDTYPDIGSVVTFPIGCVEEIIELHGKSTSEEALTFGEQSGDDGSFD